MLIGELSRRTGVSPRLLRYYEEQGLLEARRAPNGYRYYDDDTLLTVRQVRALLEAGLTTEVIRAVLPCARGEQPKFEMCVDVQAILSQALEATDERIDDLQRSRSTLAGYLGQG
ncbi:MerR family transcriptional regulator [Streptomyces rimosus]|uniref:MerR family transcriptional regulator n=1 Tax=Streptomyces TaxID=1883 RepID=UPI0004BF7837|nr:MULTISPECIES: MerR family transcriptional regulator [Streptomyces]KOT65426.1 MerR family transcriptional regulator [Streptomyces rimosus subsp. rimosus]KOT84691.1 MerR family transcriptional regulator [Streptomyces rimosus subsp. pseudoverticillatus]RSO24864.1 MerR family transcriptional regulator [Streptomyces sp. WAC 06725]